MTDIDKQVKEIELCASAHCDDGNVATGLVLGKAADTIADQSKRIEELEKQIEDALVPLNALDKLYEKSRNREVKEIQLKEPISDEKFAAILIHTHDEIIKARKTLNGGSDNG